MISEKTDMRIFPKQWLLDFCHTCMKGIKFYVF